MISGRTPGRSVVQAAALFQQTRDFAAKALPVEDDTEILAGCIRGDKASLDSFVRRFTPLVFATIKRVAEPSRGDPATAPEDLAQDVFLKIFRDGAGLLRRFDPGKASLSTWIAVIARSTALDAVRKRRPKFVLLDEGAAPEPAAEERRPALESAVPLGLLTPRQKLVLTLLFDRGMDVEKAAAFMGVGEQTVRSTKHKALERLREAFSPAPAPGKQGMGSKG